MRTVVALMLIVLGLGIALYGLANALLPIAGLYAAALDDPMKEPAGGDAKSVGEKAWRSALIGMIGVPPLIVGSTMLSAAAIRRLRRAASGG